MLAPTMMMQKQEWVKRRAYQQQSRQWHQNMLVVLFFTPHTPVKINKHAWQLHRGMLTIITVKIIFIKPQP